MKRFLVVLLLVMLAACSSRPVPGVEKTQEYTTFNETNEPYVPAENNTLPAETVVEAPEPEKEAIPEGKGFLTLAITDAAVDISELTRLNVVIRGAMIHDEVKDEWVTLDVPDREFNLLALRNKKLTELIADASVPSARYDRIQLNFGDVQVIYQGREATGRMPNQVFRAEIETIVDPRKGSVVVFDVLADQSVHVTGQGRLIFSPVINVESKRNAVVNVAGSQVVITSGDLVGRQKIGMDVDGIVGVGRSIPAGMDLSYENNKVIAKKVELPEERTITNSNSDMPEGYTYRESTIGDYGNKHSQCSLRYTGGDCL